MSNFIQWAIGEIPSEGSVEQLKIPKTRYNADSSLDIVKLQKNDKQIQDDSQILMLNKKEIASESPNIETLDKGPEKSQTNIPIELINKMDELEEEARVEQLKIDKKNANDIYVGLKMTGLSMQEYDKKYESASISRLKVDTNESPDSRTETLKADILKDLNKYFSNGEAQTLDGQKIINQMADELTKLYSRELLVKDSVDYQTYYDSVNNYVEELKVENRISEELYIQVKAKIDAERTEFIETIKKDEKAPTDISLIKILNDKKNPVISESEKIVMLNKMNKIALEEYVTTKTSSNSAVEVMPVTENDKAGLMSSLDLTSTEKFTNWYAEYVKTIRSNFIEGATLEVSAAGMKLLGMSDGQVNYATRAINTIYNRIGVDSLLNKYDGLFSKFVNYATLAVQMALAVKNGTVTPENIVWLATFWMYLDPLPITTYMNEYSYMPVYNFSDRAKKIAGLPVKLDYDLLRSGEDQEKLIVPISADATGKRIGDPDVDSSSTGLGPGTDSNSWPGDFSAKKVKKKAESSPSNTEEWNKYSDNKDNTKLLSLKDISVLPFNGRDSVKGFELRDDYKWDIKIEPFSPDGKTKPPEMIAYKDATREESSWIPVRSFDLSVNEVSYDSAELVNAAKICTPANINWLLNGSLTLLESSALWFNEWRYKYLKYIFQDGSNGSILTHSYHYMCYRLTIYLYSNMDPFIYKNDINGGEGKNRYLRKFNLIILPRISEESYHGAESSSPSSDPRLDFFIVGTEDSTILNLGNIKDE